ncbi:VOC family protein [Oceanobacillus halophilus]|uniref:Glyoxalase/bleomycin resistance/extradiol dioxygenase family protein n=1 Tax=Oceanobacillus halophilus TaxID=930130 RepID=A0A495AF50_9BACI|nr:VOC family protein [Oceanobacillus halophilus]RKQ37984.1 glyoxalase/bleomycin resistance/extradiol dioxygenase family protein [Oceanobacillus halophilus]
MELRLELFVKNIKKSVEFYRNVLDFNTPNDTKNSYSYIPVSKGNVVLGLGEMKNLPANHPVKSSDDAQQVGLGVEIVLEVQDVNDVYHKVMTKGYPIQTKLTKRPWGMVDFRIIDPDGYYIRITSN